MKRGGQEIYVGPLGHHSSHLISYFEVRKGSLVTIPDIQNQCQRLTLVTCFYQGIKGVNKIKESYNPATWMLEVTTTAQEEVLGIDFSEVYKNSELFQ